MLRRFLHREANLERHLKVANLPIFDMSTGLRNLEPPQIAQGLVGADDGNVDRVLNTLF
jgi:hypothetical protein